MGYVFFDTETTGLSPAFDQILHFAAIHTDHELVRIDDFELRSRLQPHVVPHPAAMLTNRLSIEQMLDRTLKTHPAMISEVRARLLAWSPAIFAGFNSIGFDEEMLRHGLFQTLFHPYLTSGRGCGRADAYGLVQAACALNPGCLAVPLKVDGRRDFRLASLLAANGLGTGAAHDAMSDVSGTVELCRLVKDRSPAAWERFVRLSNKVAVAEMVNEEEGFVLTEFFGGEPFHRAVVCIGSIPDNANGRFCIELGRDPDDWRLMSDDQMRSEIARKGTPLRRLKVNGAPTLTPLEEADDLIPGLDIEAARDRSRRYRSASDICARLIRVYTSDWGSAEQSPFPEACLYSGGFVNDEDLWTCGDFHDATWAERVATVSRLRDPRLRFLADRLIYFENRGALSGDQQALADYALADRLLHPVAGGPLTLGGAIEEIDRLAVQADPSSMALLSDYRNYLTDRAARAYAFRNSSSANI
ncbi:MAG: exodeoxyribonuclease I [Alphaproteobacteria bacterium]|nr:exodeoxyribonuclease I [Alphaproteobacteria bacterium]MBU0864921.1 exodeoxyribonuclease I [Alphaproteobacteria bacterium]MBU1823838.1 exodeoxyribonuclease I [Alphaproteobacteria bacterium]